VAWTEPSGHGGGTGAAAGRSLAELQRFTDAALAHLAIDDLLTELLERITEILGADTAAILLLDHEDGMLVARAAKGLEEQVRQGVRLPVGPGFAGRIAAERRMIFVPDVDHAEILNPILREKGIKSLLGAPLLVEDRVLGVLHVGSLTAREFSAEHRALLQLAADRAAIAIEHATLYEHERRARQEAERAVAVMRAVQRVTEAALSALSPAELLDELLVRIRELLGADTAAILMLEDNGRFLRARAAKGIEEEVRQGVRIPLGGGFAGRIAAERRAIFVPDVDHAEILNPILREKGIKSLLGVPLLIEGRVLGVLHVGTLRPRAFTSDDTDLLQLAADRAALAIDHAEAYEQRRIAEAVQRALLPQELLEIPGMEVAARYLPAAQAASLGGDWYDLFALGRGRVGIAIGDVVGRGLPAASLMAQLRTTLRAYALDGQGPAQVMQSLDGVLGYLSPATMTTAIYLALDAGAQTITIAGAGHPPPLVIAPDGRASYLPLEGGMALGVARGARYRDESFELLPGSTILLYTDGVVEVRGEPLEAGLERLRVVAERGHASLEALCDAVIDELVADTTIPDDVALIAGRVVPFGDRLVTRWPARAEVLASIRDIIGRWLRHHGATEDEAFDITVACQEACANAVEHAYGPGEQVFEVEAGREERTIEVIVRDHGQWRRPRGVNRGRGLPMMEALMHSVEVDRTGAGTTVVLRRVVGEAQAA
jgi:serine phosphatase RsbU (regulator of sigma subunit)/anti-sigma regulatory factor (Ser/Thr protein kinase)/putative methionine-R-sulfoxide reductase with GAF domain